MGQIWRIQHLHWAFVTNTESSCEGPWVELLGPLGLCLQGGGKSYSQTDQAMLPRRWSTSPGMWRSGREASVSEMSQTLAEGQKGNAVLSQSWSVTRSWCCSSAGLCPTLFFLQTCGRALAGDHLSEKLKEHITEPWSGWWAITLFPQQCWKKWILEPIMETTQLESWMGRMVHLERDYWHPCLLDLPYFEIAKS